MPPRTMTGASCLNPYRLGLPAELRWRGRAGPSIAPSSWSTPRSNRSEVLQDDLRCPEPAHRRMAVQRRVWTASGHRPIRMVTDRRRLPGVSAQLRGQRRRWRRGHPGSDRPPRSPGPGRSRHRRDLALAHQPVARPRSHHEPHQRSAPVVRGQSSVPGRSPRRLVPVARSGGSRSPGPPAAPQQLAVVLRRLGVDVGARAGPVLPSYIPGRFRRLGASILLAFRTAGGFTNNWPPIMATVILATIPILVLYLFFQRYFVEGVAASGVKG